MEKSEECLCPTKKGKKDRANHLRDQIERLVAPENEPRDDTREDGLTNETPRLHSR